MSSTENASMSRGEMAAFISRLVVKSLHDYTGRGPTKARTYLNENVVTVILRDTLTAGERSLVQGGRGQMVLDIRFAFQQTMSDDLTRGVEEITGRKVDAFMSANHLDPDVAIECFVLDGVPSVRLSEEEPVE
ncbi:MAG TPA: Na-translocating system protein MpsC family protein [Solirubrobacteraceae bacterium]